MKKSDHIHFTVTAEDLTVYLVQLRWEEASQIWWTPPGQTVPKYYPGKGVKAWHYRIDALSSLTGESRELANCTYNYVSKANCVRGAMSDIAPYLE